MRFALAITCFPAKIRWFLVPVMTMGILIRLSGMTLPRLHSNWRKRLCPAYRCAAPEGGQAFASPHGIDCLCSGQVPRGTLGSVWPMDQEVPQPDHSWALIWPIAWRVCRGCCRRCMPADSASNDLIGRSWLTLPGVSGPGSLPHGDSFEMLLPPYEVFVMCIWGAVTYTLSNFGCQPSLL